MQGEIKMQPIKDKFADTSHLTVFSPNARQCGLE